ncbi:MAG: ArsB/NhaD family transporter [Candidatus Microbacterium phytovorans]|uniref:ArsB/NhaD family transporter n=1 Tax=Candidatus Microbacterium phytovorans TaxID=3121374 RepID=A0AAJ6B4L0_9MICO|nr:SLC13 family permease [Microbacterium sp.]WEK15003.1 MAG: ArsB/NhaD family transporter [Microbacterium sp.]
MDAVKLALVGVALLLAGGVAVAVGVLSPAEALGIGERVWPVLLFVVAVTVVAELAAAAGVFDVVASRVARLAGGRTVRLWLAVVALAVLATAFLSLDTTAVLLTPVVVAVARANGLSPMPFAFATVWLANTASLFLPVSNLTNLLAMHQLDDAHAGTFLLLLGPSAVVAVIVTVGLLLVLHRRELAGRFTVAAPPVIADRLQLRFAAVVVCVMMPLLVSGLEPWIPASAAAVVLGAFFLWRSPRALTFSLLPWQLVVFASGLFLVVGALEAAGSRQFIEAVAGHGSGAGDLWWLSGVGLVAANVGNNLPAYLALESAADTPERLAALLVGVNAGPLITPWASLATLLWHQRLHAVGVEVPWRRYVLWGLLAAPLTVAAAVVPLALRA